MRLIDADAMKQKTEAHGERIAYVVSFLWDIEDAPTIDAIPVEWLFDLRDRVLKEGMNPELVEWIEYILQIWSREKE